MKKVSEKEYKKRITTIASQGTDQVTFFFPKALTLTLGLVWSAMEIGPLPLMI